MFHGASAFNQHITNLPERWVGDTQVMETLFLTVDDDEGEDSDY
jgi:hypothetical protein